MMPFRYLLVNSANLLVQRFVVRLVDWLSTDCRHVMAIFHTPYGVQVVRCGEPSYEGCATHYCRQHCQGVCGIQGPDGDEDDAGEVVWAPGEDGQAKPKPKVEA